MGVFIMLYNVWYILVLLGLFFAVCFVARGPVVCDVCVLCAIFCSLFVFSVQCLFLSVRSVCSMCCAGLDLLCLLCAVVYFVCTLCSVSCVCVPYVLCVLGLCSI